MPAAAASLSLHARGEVRSEVIKLLTYLTVGRRSLAGGGLVFTWLAVVLDLARAARRRSGIRSCAKQRRFSTKRCT